MLPWILLAEARAPDGDTLRLLRRGDEFSIRLAGGNELMNSRLSGSEEALATLTLAALDTPATAHLLIGGLGMGFTLRAALADLGADARVTVSEIVPDLARWAGTHMADLFAGSLADRRVTMHLGDVGALVASSAPATFDAILLDVDNGPDGLTRPGNDRLYTASGLAAARRALAPRGVLAVWSAHEDAAFARRLGHAGFTVATERVRARRGGRGARHVIWLARRDG